MEFLETTEFKDALNDISTVCLFINSAVSQLEMSIGLVVMEVCCHKINMNTKEKDIIRSILKRGV